MTDAPVPSDEDLYVLCAQGDTAAFRQLVLRYQDMLIGYYVHRTHDFELARDLSQEVFLKLWRYAARYTVKARFSTYMYSIAHNTLIDHVRRGKNRKDTVSADAAEDSGFIEQVFTDDSPDPLERIEKSERTAFVRSAIASLKDAEQDVILHVLLESLTYRETGEILGIPEGTVKSRLHSALAHLKTFINDQPQKI